MRPVKCKQLTQNQPNLHNIEGFAAQKWADIVCGNLYQTAASLFRGPGDVRGDKGFMLPLWKLRAPNKRGFAKKG